jgi:hypothetical protein
MGPFKGIGSISLWAHTQVMLSLVDGPTWGFPMLWANLHVGFFVLIGTILLHYVEGALQLLQVDSVATVATLQLLEASVACQQPASQLQVDSVEALLKALQLLQVGFAKALLLLKAL